MSTKLTKAAAFTDIHWGAKSNSEQHNQDCLNYIDWFCQEAIDNSADHIIFLGDWFENRSAVNISTLHYSYLGAKKLNSLGIPVYFIIGNHDLYHRHTREIYSTIQFHEFSNFTIIDNPTIISDIVGDPLLCPYLFPHEYPELVKYNSVETWWGHFEFKGFIVTGYNITMQSGPDHNMFDGPTYIFSGHFHKRQRGGNVVYIGNTFPTNFSDADDSNRGMMIYNHVSKQVKFLDWDECPKYSKVSLSKLLDGKIKLPKEARIKCLIDVPLSFEESAALKQQMMQTYELREFTPEESREVADAMSNTDVEDIDTDGVQISGIDDLVIRMLRSIDTDHIDNNLLIEQYQRLK